MNGSVAEAELTDTQARYHGAVPNSRATFSKRRYTRPRTVGIWTREFTRNALMVVGFSTSVWLFQNKIGWV